MRESDTAVSAGRSRSNEDEWGLATWRRRGGGVRAVGRRIGRDDYDDVDDGDSDASVVAVNAMSHSHVPRPCPLLILPLTLHVTRSLSPRHRRAPAFRALERERHTHRERDFDIFLRLLELDALAHFYAAAGIEKWSTAMSVSVCAFTYCRELHVQTL